MGEKMTDMEENIKEKKSMEPYGEVSYTDREGNKKVISVINFVRTEFKDNRIVSIGETEEGTYILSVENPEDSERNKQACIHLTEGSLIGLLATIHLFFKETSYSLDEKLKDILKDGQMEYESFLEKNKIKNKKR